MGAASWDSKSDEQDPAQLPDRVLPGVARQGALQELKPECLLPQAALEPDLAQQEAQQRRRAPVREAWLPRLEEVAEAERRQRAPGQPQQPERASEAEAEPEPEPPRA